MTRNNLKRDIGDVHWALKTFAPDERRLNTDMLYYSFGEGRSVNSMKAFERILKRLEELEAKQSSQP